MYLFGPVDHATSRCICDGLYSIWCRMKLEKVLQTSDWCIIKLEKNCLENSDVQFVRHETVLMFCE